MKKICALTLAAVMLCSMLFLTGCGEKNSITAEDFKTAMEGLGYTVEDASEQFSAFDQIEQVYIAIDENGAYQIEFYEFDSDESAQLMFTGNKTIFEESAVSGYTQSSVSLANYNTYNLTSGGQFKALSRINNTMIYLDVPTDYKDAVKTVLEQLGY